MTIAERQAREAHDRENPWRNMNEARRPWLICNLMLNDRAGHHDTEKRYVEMDGEWWDIEAESPVLFPVLHWRAAYMTVSLAKRNTMKKRYNERWS